MGTTSQSNAEIQRAHAVSIRPALLMFKRIISSEDFAWPPLANEITISAELLKHLLRLALKSVDVDETFYLRSYSDVKAAIEEGRFANAQHHFIEFGYFEDRMPHRIEVDEDFYLTANPDVKRSVEAGEIPSGQYHFERTGYREGRIPQVNWSLIAGKR
jgi:hypothetical protein